MKKTILFIALFAFCGFASAQLNPSLEIWTGTEPDFWTTNNQYAAPLGITGQFVYQDSDASLGNYSARLVTNDCPNCDSLGFSDPFVGFMDQVIPITWNYTEPMCFAFDYKYLPAAITDTGVCQVKVTHWDSGTNSQMIDYYAEFKISEQATWSTATSELFDNPGTGIPDTILMQFLTSATAIGGTGTDTDGTELFIDNIRIITQASCEVGLLADQIIDVQAYPNPASDFVVFEFDSEEVNYVDFIDLTGEIVQSSKLTNGRNEIELPNLANGAYSYIIYSKIARKIASGKILVHEE